MFQEELTAMTDREVAITALLPNTINTFEYTRNHHFIRLSLKDGKSLKLVAQSRMLYFCPAGCLEFLTESNHGEIKCPICGTKMKSKWGKEQVCFVPDDDSDFEFPPK